MADKPTKKSFHKQLRNQMIVKFLIYTNIFKALLVRGIMVGHGLLAMWRAVETLENIMMWLMALILLPLICETIYRVWKRRGIENEWFLPAFLFYIIMVVPSIWILELDRLSKNTGAAALGSSIPLALNAELVVFALEQSLLLIIVFGRWLVPKPTVAKENISQLLFSFIGKASDMIIFFQLFDEPDIRNDTMLKYILLSVWTLSLVQFTVDFTGIRPEAEAVNVPTNKDIVKNAGKAKVHIISDGKHEEAFTPPVIEQPEVITKAKSCIRMDPDKCSALLTIFTQELPYLVMRGYILATKDITSYSILFFLAKNALVIILFIYKSLSSLFLRMKGWRKKPVPAVVPVKSNEIVEVRDDCDADEIEDIENDFVDLETPEVEDVKKEKI